MQRHQHCQHAFPCPHRPDTIASKTALQAKWRETVGRFSPECAGKQESPDGKRVPRSRVYVKGKDKLFFIHTALQSDKHRHLLYPDKALQSDSFVQNAPNAETIKQIEDSTLVFVDRANTTIKHVRGGHIRPPKRQMGRVRCVFFKKNKTEHTCSDPSVLHFIQMLQRRHRHPTYLFKIRGHSPRCNAPMYPISLTSFGGASARRQRGVGTSASSGKHMPLPTRKTTWTTAEAFRASSTFPENFSKQFETQHNRKLTVDDLNTIQTAKEWQKHHRRDAILSMTCRQCNLKNK